MVSVAQEAPPAEKAWPGRSRRPGRRWPHDPEQQVERLSEALALTAEQKTKIVAIYKDQAAALKRSHRKNAAKRAWR